MWKEFRDFIAKGNLIDIAVAFIMGAAFGALVGSFIDDIVMPLVGKLIGNVDFAGLYVNLSGRGYASAAAAREAGAAAVYYGTFVNTLVSFLLVAFFMFLLVKAAMKARRPKVAPTTKPCPFCATRIPIAASRCPNCTSELPAGS